MDERQAHDTVGLLALLGGWSNKVLSRPEFSMDASDPSPFLTSAS